MEQTENQIPQVPEATSLMTRITNVFTSPSELYTEVAANPVKTSSWLVPLLISIIIALISIVAIYSNDTLRNQIYEMQSKRMEQMVQEGRMTQEQSNAAVEGMQNTGFGMFLLFGGVSVLFMIVISFFVAALFLWLTSKIGLKFSGKYAKILEIYGLASFIGILGGIITILLMFVLDSMYAAPSPTIFMLNSFDTTNKAHIILAQLNIFTIWQTGIIGLGISKVTNKSIGTGLGVAFGLWILWVIISTLTGIGIR
jgi:hypothetical protein